MKRRRQFKAIAFLLALVMLFGMMPVTALELETTTGEISTPEAETAVPSVDIFPNSDYVEENQTYEVIERREANVKHFRLEDGSCVAVSYGYPVHRKDANGEWQDIDNRLFSAAVSGKNVYSTADNRVTFSEHIGNGELMTLNENGYTVRLGYLAPSTGMIATRPAVAINNHISRETQLQTISPNSSEAEKLEQLHTVNNTTSVLYESVQQGIDLKYVLQANDIKEYIVVETPQSSYVYRFGLMLEGLEAELTAQGSIILRDTETDEEPYMIPAPFMVDANGVISTDVCYELEQIEDGAYILTVEADAAWFGQTERAYPVMIDPTIQQRAHTDTYITAANPDMAPFDDVVLWVGTNKIAYIRPSLNSIPQGSEVDFATLNIAYYFLNNVVDGTINVGIYQVNQNWNSSLTWNIASSMSNYGLSTTRLSYRTLRGDSGAYVSTPKWQSFVITDAVNSWFNGSTNNGVAIKRESGTLLDVVVYSLNYTTTYAPYFIIFYTEPVEEGVYRLRNAYSGLYLTTAGINYKTGAPLQQSSKTETVNGEINRAQLFKISYIQSYGYDQYYDIRPMTNSALGLDAPITGTDRSVKANTIATTDEWFDIPQTQRWVIETDGYSGNDLRRITLQNAFSDNGGYLTAPSSFTSGGAITTTTTPTLNSEWYLEPYTGEEMKGVRMTSYTYSLECGKTFDYDAFMYSSSVGVNGPVTYYVTNEDYSTTDKATIDTTTGLLTAIQPGTIRVRFTYAGTSTYWSIVVTLTTPFEDGIIHTLKNVSNNMLMKPQTADLNSTIIVNTYSNSQTSMMWKFEYVSDGYYKIKNDITGYYLRAPANNTSGASVTQSTYSSTYGLWRFIETTDGYYMIQSKNQYERNASSPLYISVSENDVVQSSYSTASKWDIRALTMNLTLYHDQAFSDMYSEIGVNAVDALNNILSYNKNNEEDYRSVEQFFKEEFGIKINLQINTTIYESFPYANDCLYKDDPDALCDNCKNEGSTTDTPYSHCVANHHHKSANKFVTCTPQSNISINVLLTGHMASCGYDGTSHTSKTTVLGRAEGVGYGNRCALFLSTFGDISDYNAVKLTFVHEILHLLNASHHYTSDDNIYCIHGSRRHSEDVTVPLLICDQCIDKVDAYKLRTFYNHNA